MRDFAGKTAFITGGGSGIGLAMARAFLARGMNVVLADLLQQHLDEAAEEHGHTNRVLAIRLDVTDRDAMAEAERRTAATFGKTHVLCNNVGVSQRNPIDEASYADWDYVIDVNLGGTVNGLVSFLPGMKSHGEGGHVVNTSSMAGMIPVPSFAGIYATSKFAIRGMTDALRLALAPYGIGASVLCPGLTRTRAISAGELYRKVHEGEAVEELRDPIEGGMELDEIGEYVARAIEQNAPYIFPHGEFKEEVARYFNEMLEAFSTNVEPDPRRKEAEERRAQMTAEAKALADALGHEE
jgi:NAD(P)-dependent dehydrogenase (short-subunit alcohol dehydrogenase family)